jgi:hypothetical protein
MVASAIIAEQRARAAAAKARERRHAEPRRPARDVEGPIHRSVTRYLRTTLPSGWLISHVANKPRSAQQGAREKAMGAMAGWPDIQIHGPGPDGPSAWFMEIKAPGGRLSDAQHDVIDALLDCGFPVEVVRSVEDARAAVAKWRLPSTDALIARRVA